MMLFLSLPVLAKPAAAPVAPDIPFTPKALTVGGRTVTAELCKVDGTPMRRKGTAKPAIRAIQPTADGFLYVLDQAASLRKYKTAADCTLTLDPTFGAGGALSLGSKPDDYEALAIAPSGAVIVSADGFSPPLRVSNGVVTPACTANVANKPIVSDLGQKRATYDRKWVDLDAGCAGDPIALDGWPDDLFFAKVVPDGDGVLVWGQLDKQNKVGGFGADRKRQVLFGDSEGPGAFSFVRGVERWGTDYAVLDSNNRRFTVWDSAGALKYAVPLKDLGLDYISINDFDRVGDVVWVALDHDPGAMHEELIGAIVRLNGL